MADYAQNTRHPHQTVVCTDAWLMAKPTENKCLRVIDRIALCVIVTRNNGSMVDADTGKFGAEWHDCNYSLMPTGDGRYFVTRVV